jgi:hypothetical protein
MAQHHSMHRSVKLAVVYDMKTISLFVDGQASKDSVVRDDKTGKLSSQEFPTLLRGDGRGTRIGQLHNKFPFHGIIDEVRISNIARYDKDYIPTKRFTTDENTLALYHFDSGTGTVLKDSSGNGHHGNIVGAEWVRVDDELNVIDSPNSTHIWPQDQPAPAIAPFGAEQAKQHQEEWAEHLGVEVETTNSVGMKMRLIPPGEFLMGTTDEEIELLSAKAKEEGAPDWYTVRLPAERPQHHVTLTKPFFLSNWEVTRGQFRVA